MVWGLPFDRRSSDLGYLEVAPQCVLVAAMIVLIIFWALILALLEWAGCRDGNPNRSRYGFIDVVIGADGRVSTSQTVVPGGGERYSH
jgi:hypothetical protein